jgi:hypothetical protein
MKRQKKIERATPSRSMRTPLADERAEIAAPRTIADPTIPRPKPLTVILPSSNAPRATAKRRT